MKAMKAGVTKAGKGIDNLVWNILGQTYTPKHLTESSFSWHALLPPGRPPLAQQRQQVGREHGVAVAAPLAALDPEQHALAVDVRDLEGCDLRHAQPHH